MRAFDFAEIKVSVRFMIMGCRQMAAYCQPWDNVGSTGLMYLSSYQPCF